MSFRAHFLHRELLFAVDFSPDFRYVVAVRNTRTAEERRRSTV
ncbi:hypothetical protein HMPREF0239_02827 [Clostridium sp. ATCC BAA-442]|nr:hypothetical protein HMPREF0239_02827 [Clostridium sp. ATCC BAA-442]